MVGIRHKVKNQISFQINQRKKDKKTNSLSLSLVKDLHLIAPLIDNKLQI